jgi:crotonobetainyl-CoA:carnitine CoA-transferase CaiB-like acyl-CoA transferase
MATAEPTATAPAPCALSGLRVLDLSESVAGQFCARMFADQGAQVSLIEPPGGSAVRAMPPFDPVTPGIGSQLFFHLNLGKDSRQIDLTTTDGTATLQRLAEQADVIVAGLGLDLVAMQRDHPTCVVVQVSDFGSDGPLAHWRGSEMIFQALSGMMNENGLPGREPLYGVGHRAQYAAGVGAFISALAALHVRGSTGRGQRVDLDVALNTVAMAPPGITEYSYSGLQEIRGDVRRPFMCVQCRDGWVALWLQQATWGVFCGTLRLAALEHDPRFALFKSRLDHWPELEARVQQEVRAWGADDLLQRLLNGRIAAAKAYRASQLWSDMPHLAARNYWQTVNTAAGPRVVLGPQFRFSHTPSSAPVGAPDLGEQRSDHTSRHDPRWRLAQVERSPRSATPATGDPTPGPLAGVRVLDFTTAWAGPLSGRILAFLGAEVIKVESASSPDLWRHAASPILPRRYPDGIAGERRYNRCALYNSQNLDKLSLCLDLKHPQGLAAIQRVAAATDIVLCNFSGGTLARMGLGYEVLCQARPDIIVVEMPGFGNTGPMSKAAANGTTMEMAAGMGGMIGYPGGAPQTTGQYYPDPIGGFHGAAAALLALLHRQASGQGQHVELPQVEASMTFIGEELLHALASGVDPQPQGNRVRWAAPHDTYRTQGDDAWVAIAVETNDEWRRLCALINQPGLADDPRFAEFEARWRNQDLLREPITAWTQTMQKAQLAELLQGVGIRAAPVNKPPDLLDSPYLAARQGFVEMTHPEAGQHRYLNLPFRLSATPAAHRVAAPCLGADSHRVLRQIAGLSAAEVDELERLGVLSAVPLD